MAASTTPLTNTPLSTRSMRRWQQHIGQFTLLVVTLIGIIAFMSPFWSRAITSADTSGAHLSDSPLITGVIGVACLVVVFANLGPSLSSKSIALLGVLVGINSVLRILKVAFFIPGEFTPVFVLITLVGYVFGAQMGFLMGALTLLSSAILMGGIGPWLPFQMLCAGWMGLTASWIRPGKNPRLPHEVIRLAIFGFVWGILYGVIINLYFWPFMTDAWHPGLSAGDTLTRYLTFYFVQSVGPDLTRSVGNAVLLLAVGGPLLTIFRRFRSRFDYTMVEVISPLPISEPGTGN